MRRGACTHRYMEHLTDDDLCRLTAALAQALRDAMAWHAPPRLYGLVPSHQSLEDLFVELVESREP